MPQDATNPSIDVFPELPPYQWYSMPVYFQPAPWSEERIALLGGVRFAGMRAGCEDAPEPARTVYVAPFIPSERLVLLYGDRADGPIRILDMACRSLTYHLEDGGNLADWRPPLSGLFPGTVLESSVTDCESVFRMLLEDHASLGRTSAPRNPAREADGVPQLHIHPLEINHGDQFIVGNTAGLRLLRDLCDRALTDGAAENQSQDPDHDETPFPADCEGYDLYVQRDDDPDRFSRRTLPYLRGAEWGLDGGEIAPWETFPGFGDAGK